MRRLGSHDLIHDIEHVPNENFVESKRESRPNGPASSYTELLSRYCTSSS